MRTRAHLSDRPNIYGYYEIRWSEVVKGKWRSKRQSTGESEYPAAIAALSRFLSLRDDDVEQLDRTVSDVWDAYLRSYSRPRGNAKTDAFAMRAPLECFGDHPAAAVRDADVEAYTARRERGAYGSRKVKPSTIRRELTQLQAVLNWGSKKGMIRGKPRFEFPKPNDGPPRDKWMTEADQKKLLDAIKDEPASTRAFVRLALTYGVRKGAIMDLRFGDQVDFLTGSIDFHVPGKRVTRKRRPVVPMTRTIRADFEELFSCKGRGAFVVDRGAPYQVEKLLERLGLGWVTPHVFKHTAITQLRRDGVDIEEIAKFTATDVRTIRKVYRHHSHEELLSIAELRGI